MKRILKQFMGLTISVIIVLLFILGGYIKNGGPIKENYSNSDDLITFEIGNINLLFTGWEGFVNLNGENQRIFGPKDRNLSYFYSEEDTKKKGKGRVYWSNDNKDPQKIGYIINNPQFKPYRKLELFVETNGILENAGYGFKLEGYDVYLSNGTILKNDHKEIDGKFDGTNYKGNKGFYQIFYNQKNAIIIAGDFASVDNLFKWEFFLPWINQNDGKKFSPLYIIYFDKVNLKFEENRWNLESKSFTGNIEDYIEEVKRDLDNQ